MHQTAAPGRRARSRRTGRILALLLALASAGAAGAQQARIGYVDLQRLLDNAPQMSDSSERLRAEFAERDRALKADEARLAGLQDRQRREAGLVTPDAGAALAAEVEALERRVRRTREALRAELRRRGEEETEQRWREVNEAVAAFAREQGYDLIVASPVFYASPAIDVTDQVLARLRTGSGQRPP
ncbi:MAG: OmpH family outer membrane protein [Pseudoxanthomonas sp.]|nr:OmpH family outer membrane protein [Pseudoxanthomonas sp.]